MPSFAKITVAGNVGKDPQLRFTPSGMAICSFSVAVSSGKKKEDGTWDNETDWYNISVFGDKALRAHQAIAKGNPVCIQGRFKPRKYTDKNGIEQTSYEIACDEYFTVKKGSGENLDEQMQFDQQSQGEHAVQAQQNTSAALKAAATAGLSNPAAPPITDDDIPF